MDYWQFLTISSAVCSIVGFFITIFSKYSWGKRILWSVVIFILTFISGYAVNRNSENERIKSIHRQAKAIYDDYVPSGNEKEFIQESLAFLEENKDRYPDSYNRAVQIYSDMKNSTIQYSYEPAIEIRGIIKGIVTLNGE
ncbi:MAG: hypothetical protein PUD97_02585 [Paludibacteraceae bacterium]|nr:hypothetical protein [Paludibacteraceae bacterium]